MRRRTVALDRLTCLVAGAAVLAVGLSVAAWQRGLLPVPIGTPLRLPQLDTVLAATWWPFALGAAAIALIAIGVSWLYSHRPGQTPGPAVLPGSSGANLLTVDLSSAATAAAAGLAQHPDVVSARGRCRFDRGQSVIELRLEIDPKVDLAALTTALADTRRDLGSALDGVAFTSRVLLRTQRHPGHPARVT